MFQNRSQRSSSQQQQQSQQQYNAWIAKYQTIRSEFRRHEHAQRQRVLEQATKPRYDSEGRVLPKPLDHLTNPDGSAVNSRQLLQDLLNTSDDSARRRDIAIRQLQLAQIIDSQTEQTIKPPTPGLLPPSIRPLFDMQMGTTGLAAWVQYARSAIEQLAVLSMFIAIPVGFSNLANAESINFSTNTRALLGEAGKFADRNNLLIFNFVAKSVKIIRNDKPVWLKMHELQGALVQLATTTQVSKLSLYLIGEISSGGTGLVGSAGLIVTAVLLPGTISFIVEKVVVDKIQLGIYQRIAGDKANNYQDNSSENKQEQTNSELGRRLLVMEQNHRDWIREQNLQNSSFVWRVVTEPATWGTGSKLGLTAAWLYYTQDFGKTDSRIAKWLVELADNVVSKYLVFTAIHTIVTRVLMPFAVSAADWIWIRTIPEDKRVEFYRWLVKRRLYRIVSIIQPLLETSLNTFLRTALDTRGLRARLFDQPKIEETEFEKAKTKKSIFENRSAKPKVSKTPSVAPPAPRPATASDEDSKEWFKQHPEMVQLMDQLQIWGDYGTYFNNPNYSQLSSLYATDHVLTNKYNNQPLPASVQKQLVQLLSRAAPPISELPKSWSSVDVMTWLVGRPPISRYMPLDERQVKQAEIQKLIHQFGKAPNLSKPAVATVQGMGGNPVMKIQHNSTETTCTVLDMANKTIGTFFPNDGGGKIINNNGNHVFTVTPNNTVVSVPAQAFIGNVVSTPQIWNEPLMTDVNNTQTLLAGYPAPLADLILFSSTNNETMLNGNITHDFRGIHLNITNGTGDIILAKAENGSFSTGALVSDAVSSGSADSINVSSSLGNWSFTGTFNKTKPEQIQQQLFNYNKSLEEYLGYPVANLSQNMTTPVPPGFFENVSSVPLNATTTTTTPGWFNWTAFNFYDRYLKPLVETPTSSIENKPNSTTWLPPDYFQTKSGFFEGPISNEVPDPNLAPNPKPSNLPAGSINKTPESNVLLLQPTSSLENKPNSTTWLPSEFFKTSRPANFQPLVEEPFTPINASRFSVIPPGFFDMPFLNQDQIPMIPIPDSAEYFQVANTSLELVVKDLERAAADEQKNWTALGEFAEIIDEIKNDMNHTSDTVDSEQTPTKGSNSESDNNIGSSKTSSNGNENGGSETFTEPAKQSNEGSSLVQVTTIGSEPDPESTTEQKTEELVEPPETEVTEIQDETIIKPDEKTTVPIDDVNKLQEGILKEMQKSEFSDPLFEEQQKVAAFVNATDFIHTLVNQFKPPIVEQQQELAMVQEQTTTETFANSTATTTLPNYFPLEQAAEVFKRAQECEAKHAKPWSQSGGIVRDANNNIIDSTCLFPTPGKELLKYAIDFIVSGQTQLAHIGIAATTVAASPLGALGSIASWSLVPSINDETMNAVAKMPDSAIDTTIAKVWESVTGVAPKVKEFNLLLQSLYSEQFVRDQVYVHPSDILKMSMLEIDQMLKLSESTKDYGELLKQALSSRLLALILFGSEDVSPIYHNREQVLEILNSGLTEPLTKATQSWSVIIAWTLVSNNARAVETIIPAIEVVGDALQTVTDWRTDLDGRLLLSKLTDLSPNDLPQDKSIDIVNNLIAALQRTHRLTKDHDSLERHVKQVLLTYYGIDAKTIGEATIRYGDLGGVSSFLDQDELKFLTAGIVKFDWQDWKQNYTPYERDPKLIHQVKQLVSLTTDETERFNRIKRQLYTRGYDPLTVYEILGHLITDPADHMRKLLQVDRLEWSYLKSPIAKWNNSGKYDWNELEPFDEDLLARKPLSSAEKPIALVSYWMKMARATRDPTYETDIREILSKHYGLDRAKLERLPKITFADLGGPDSRLDEQDISLLLGDELGSKFDTDDFIKSYNGLQRNPGFARLLDQLNKMSLEERLEIVNGQEFVIPTNLQNDDDLVLIFDRLFSDDTGAKNKYIQKYVSNGYLAKKLVANVGWFIWDNLVGSE